MRNIILLFFALQICRVNAFAQTAVQGTYSMKLTGGRILFGTGDVVGFVVGIEASKNILKKQRAGLSRLLVGAEFNFENGVKNPKVNDISIQDFFQRSFYHVSNTVLTAKLTYYPFRKILSGFNIAVGPSLGYSFQSSEGRSSLLLFPNDQYYRSSFLRYNNDWLIGYRISTGYELKLTRKLLTGVRFDFSSYTNGDINTMPALKVGMTW